MKHVPDVHVALRPSRFLIGFTLAGALATITLIAMLPLPWWCKAMIVVACIAATVLELRRLRLAGSQLITVSEHRRVTITEGHQRECGGDVLDASYVTGWFTSIVWRANGARFARVIPVACDALASEDARRLRVLLRYGRAESLASNGVAASARAWLKGDLMS